MNTTTKTTERKAKRGPAPLPETEKRGHCVSVRLNDAELATLDANRKQNRMQRGEWLRSAALDVLPPVIPSCNSELWTKLAPVSANLNQLQHRLNASGSDMDAAVVNAAMREVNKLRAVLIGSDAL